MKFTKAHRSTQLKQEKHPTQYSLFFFFTFVNFDPQNQPEYRMYKCPSTQKIQKNKTESNYLLPLPRVYPSHHFAKIPRLAACSFQLARRVAISAFVDPRFCVVRFENRPLEESTELPRRSPMPGALGKASSTRLLPFEEVEVLESFILGVRFALEMYIWTDGYG
jgi:hypothetical protein